MIISITHCKYALIRVPQAGEMVTEKILRGKDITIMENLTDSVRKRWRQDRVVHGMWQALQWQPLTLGKRHLPLNTQQLMDGPKALCLCHAILSSHKGEWHSAPHYSMDELWKNCLMGKKPGTEAISLWLHCIKYSEWMNSYKQKESREREERGVISKSVWGFFLTWWKYSETR